MSPVKKNHTVGNHVATQMILMFRGQLFELMMSFANVFVKISNVNISNMSLIFI